MLYCICRYYRGDGTGRVRGIESGVFALNNQSLKWGLNIYCYSLFHHLSAIIVSYEYHWKYPQLTHNLVSVFYSLFSLPQLTDLLCCINQLTLYFKRIGLDSAQLC